MRLLLYLFYCSYYTCKGGGSTCSKMRSAPDLDVRFGAGRGRGSKGSNPCPLGGSSASPQRRHPSGAPVAWGSLALRRRQLWQPRGMAPPSLQRALLCSSFLPSVRHMRRPSRSPSPSSLPSPATPPVAAEFPCKYAHLAPSSRDWNLGWE